jgi:hypothetical protein
MNTNHVDSRAVKRRIREVLTPANTLRTRDSSGDNRDSAFPQSDCVFKVCCDVTEPGLPSNDGGYTGPGLVLDINSLNEIRSGQKFGRYTTNQDDSV